MTQKLMVGTWVPKQVADEIKSVVSKGQYVNSSDFIRQAIREKLENEKQ